MNQKDIDLYAVIWCGEMMNLESLDAVCFSEADAEAVIAASPGRRESYMIERWSLALQLASESHAWLGERVLERLKAGDLSPLVLRDEAERAKRAAG